MSEIKAKTRGHIPYLPWIPNPFRTYTVDSQNITLKKIFEKNSASTKLSNIDVSTGLIAKMTDTGAIKVFEGGRERFTMHRVRDCSWFARQINEAIHAPPPEAEPAWDADHILRPYIVKVPALPSILYKALSQKGQGSSGSLLKWHVKPGDMVEAGTVIAEYNVDALRVPEGKMTAPLIMPHSGKITRINKRIEHADWGTSEDKNSTLNEVIPPDHIQFEFQFACTDAMISDITEPGRDEIKDFGYWLRFNQCAFKQAALYAEVALLKGCKVDEKSYHDVWYQSPTHPFKKAWAASGPGSSMVEYHGGNSPKVYRYSTPEI